MLTLAIETSCDETAVSLLRTEAFNEELLPHKIAVLSHVVESQTEIHSPFGGVVPEVAARDHLAKIAGITQQALLNAQLKTTDLDVIAVTMGPGLIGALMVGVLFARGLATSLGIPLKAINHVDAHLAPALLTQYFSPKTHLGQELEIPKIAYPALALTVSGGHCHLVRINSPTERIVLGKTADDACGEAFDKVAKLLGLPYPGGPFLEVLAKNAQGGMFPFPATLSDRQNRMGFSFSGLKTAVLEAIRKLQGNPLGKISGASLPDNVKAELAWSFQEAALGQLLDRTKNALADHKDEFQCVLVAGGVAANRRFRDLFQTLSVPVHFAPLALCSDNATMIALQSLISWEDGFVKQPFPRYL